jgi:predicted DNA-binding ribbon-helix-helix protein
MGERMHRTQILLEPAQHKALNEIARSEGRSVSEVVREIIRERLEEREQEVSAEVKRRLEALERIRAHREAILARRGGKPIEIDVVEMINQMREERDAENFAIILGHRD